MRLVVTVVECDTFGCNSVARIENADAWVVTKRRDLCPDHVPAPEWSLAYMRMPRICLGCVECIPPRAA